MSQQVEATRQAAESARLEMRAEFTQQLEALTAKVETNSQANDRYQAALQAALEERLAEFANHQHQTLTTINAKLAGLPAMVQAELPAQFAPLSQALREYLEHKTAAVETSESHVPLLRIHKMSHVPTTSLDVNGVPSLHVAARRVIVMTALTSVWEHLLWCSGRGRFNSWWLGGGRLVWLWVGGCGGWVGAGGDPAHALNTRVSSTIRLKRAETFLDIRFFSFDTFKIEWNLMFTCKKELLLFESITSFKGGFWRIKTNNRAHE